MEAIFFLIESCLVGGWWGVTGFSSLAVIISFWVVLIIAFLFFFLFGYHLIKYGVNHDSIVAIIFGVIFCGFWLGILLYFLLDKRKERRAKRAEMACERNARIMKARIEAQVRAEMEMKTKTTVEDKIKREIEAKVRTEIEAERKQKIEETVLQMEEALQTIEAAKRKLKLEKEKSEEPEREKNEE